MKYRDRKEAGYILGERLLSVVGKDVIVLAIANGGVLVGEAIAQILKCPLHIIVVRKIQIPGNPEAGFGSITSSGKVFFNELLLKYLKLSKEQINKCIEKTKKQIEERLKIFNLQKDYLKVVKDKEVVLTDDGLATGYTMISAIESVKEYKPKRIIVAIPTSSDTAISRIKKRVDKLICPDVRPGYYFAVADAYQNWYDVSENEVIDILKNFRI